MLTHMYKLTYGLIDEVSGEHLNSTHSRTRGSHQFKFHVPYAKKTFFPKNYSGLKLPP